MRTPSLLRLLRAAVFAAVCVSLATAAHVLAGGSAPGHPVLAASYALILIPAFALTSRERRLPSIATTLLATQLALHLLFDATTAHVPLPGTLPALAHACGSLGGPGAVMTIAHLWAALVSSWWLARGEAAMWALARLAARLAGRAVRLPRAPRAPVPATASAAPPPDPVLPRPAPARHPVRRRGPPRPALTRAA
ncbi:MAG TPA: MFS transporter [Streptosporangiaceae bacterium]|jgi:hypothetical protein